MPTLLFTFHPTFFFLRQGLSPAWNLPSHLDSECPEPVHLCLNKVLNNLVLESYFFPMFPKQFLILSIEIFVHKPFYILLYSIIPF